MIDVLVADDHAVVRKGLIQIISDTTDINVAGEACNGQDVLDKIEKKTFDVILLDIHLPGKSGLDVLKQLKKDMPFLSTLILTIYPEEQYAIRALKLGASGYLTKDSAPDELVNAIRKVASGGKYISASLAEKLASFIEYNKEQSPHETLSNREYQIMLLIAIGKTVKEISQELSISAKTVSTYRTRILVKMNMTKDAEIIHYAINNKLIE